VFDPTAIYIYRFIDGWLGSNRVQVEETLGILPWNGFAISQEAALGAKLDDVLSR
jgi:hypothetical protein